MSTMEAGGPDALRTRGSWVGMGVSIANFTRCPPTEASVAGVS